MNFDGSGVAGCPETTSEGRWTRAPLTSMMSGPHHSDSSVGGVPTWTRVIASVGGGPFGSDGSTCQCLGSVSFMCRPKPFVATSSGGPEDEDTAEAVQADATASPAKRTQTLPAFIAVRTSPHSQVGGS